MSHLMLFAQIVNVSPIDLFACAFCFVLFNKRRRKEKKLQPKYLV